MRVISGELEPNPGRAEHQRGGELAAGPANDGYSVTCPKSDPDGLTPQRIREDRAQRRDLPGVRSRGTGALPVLGSDRLRSPQKTRFEISAGARSSSFSSSSIFSSVSEAPAISREVQYSFT